MRIDRLPFQIHRSILSASPAGTYYEYELVDERDGRILATARTNQPFAPKQMRNYQAARNTNLILDLAIDRR